MKNKPCPFCGETEIEVIRPGTYRASRQVKCTNCGCELETNEIDSWDQWNFRYNKIDKLLDTQDFYELMQQYRTSPMTDQKLVVESFENVKQWIRENL
jgi:transcription elongation factor Elf1